MNFIYDQDTNLIMTEENMGVLIKAVEIKPVNNGHVDMTVGEFSENNIVTFYSRSKREYVVREMSASGSNVIIITLLGSPDPSGVAIKLLHYLKKNGADLIWASGVCLLPDDFLGKYKDQYNIDEETCSWEGIVSLPEGSVSRQAIEEHAMTIDENRILKAVIINTIK